MKPEIQLLKYWLSQPGNGPVKLAGIFGYESSETVNKWIERGNIPKFRLQQVLEVISESSESGNKGKNSKTTPTAASRN